MMQVLRGIWGLTVAMGLWAAANVPAHAGRLPDEVVFVGAGKFEALMARGQRENWRALPIGERTARAGLAMVGTPYVNYTLELDETIETPCANFKGMDCWTFFENALAAARALRVAARPDRATFLRFIEMDRYRNGRCDGTFVSRLHHLEDWLQDNQRRGLVEDVTPRLPGARRLHREMNYMGGGGSSHFRQLRANPQWIPALARVEADLSRRGIYYLPKAAVPAAEKYLRNGDIICIVTTWHGSYTSHVGLAYRDKKGVLRFMHASRNERRVLVDSRLSDYLNRYSLHAGIMVARPKEG